MWLQPLSFLTLDAKSGRTGRRRRPALARCEKEGYSGLARRSNTPPAGGFQPRSLPDCIQTAGLEKISQDKELNSYFVREHG
jgi:hypothetical protein